MAAKFAGVNKNWCPFGCPDDELDEYGYCYHLIGFTNDKKRIELMKRLKKTDDKGKEVDTGHVAIQVPYTTQRLGPKHIKKVYQYERARPGDQFVQISTSWRVYRNIPRPEDFPEEEIQVANDDVDDTEEAEELVEAE